MSPTSPTPARPGPKRTTSRVRFQDLGFTPVGGDGDGRGEDEERTRAGLGTGRGSEPGTPNIVEAAAHLRRTLSLANLDTLLLLTSTATASLTTSLSPTRSPKTSKIKPFSPSKSKPSTITTTFTSEKTAVFTTGAPESSTTEEGGESLLSALSSPDRVDVSDSAEEKAVLELERRRREARELLRGVKGAVWRPAGEGKKLPGDLERVFVLAMQKATRSFISAYGLRAGVNLVLFLFKTVSTRSFSPSHLRQALLSSGPLRFSLLLSTFTYLYTLTSQTLRLAPSPTYLRRRLSHSLSLLRRTTSQTTSLLEALEEGLDCLATDEAPFGPASAEWDETDGERRWHASVAGFVAGGAIYWVKGGERRGVIEQVVVRGLEGFWKGATRRLGWHIPGGEILLFGLCSGQLMHSWLAASERNPPAFDHFISNAFQGPFPAIAIQRSLLDSGVMPKVEVEKLLSRRTVSGPNRSSLQAILASLGDRDLVWQGGRMIPCSALHPDHTHCIPNLFARFLLVFQHMLPVYAALHFIPQLIFKRRLLFSQPVDATTTPASGMDAPSLDAPKKARKGKINWKELTKLLWRGLKGTLRSGSFLSGFVVIFHAVVCLQHKLYPLLNPGRVRDLLVSSKLMWVAGLSTSLSLFLEEKRRRSELALYVLPRGLQILHSSARKRAWIPRHVPLGEGVLTGLAMGVLCDRARWGPEDLGGLVKRMMYQFT